MKRKVKTGNPTMNIAINKSRIKLYNTDSLEPTYYLKDEQEFQIELYNPTTNYVLCKIKLNTENVSGGGIVLRPGERIFLERYIETPNKFKFETYSVDSSKETLKAIGNNGDIEVSFYNETPTKKVVYNPGINQSLRCFNPNTPYYGLTTNFYDSGTNNTGGIQSVFQNNSDFTFTSSTGLPTLDSIETGRVETGRVEKGSHSNQEFTSVSKSWEFIPFHEVSYKLLPVSRKVVTVEDTIVRYCVECGKKTKPNFKFCPNCGTSI